MYRIRFLFIMLRCLFEQPKSILDEFELSFWAIPFLDTDISRLFTQTYASMTALGRWHYVFSSQFKKAAVQDRWIPVTTAETFTFRRSIRAFQRIRMVTKIICWNEKCFFVQQTFYVGRELYAQAISQGIVRNPQGPMKPPDVFTSFGIDIPSPPMPEPIRAWYSMRELSHTAQNV
jgi:hypothetical protein